MKIYVAADHAGFPLKEKLKPYLTGLGHEVVDCGAHELAEGDDYPDIVTECANRVVGDEDSYGIVIGGSGQGEAMAANRISGIRAAVYYGSTGKKQTDADGNALDIIESERLHNDANILSLGARFLKEQDAKEATRRFLETPFSGDARHIRRIEKIG